MYMNNVIFPIVAIKKRKQSDMTSNMRHFLILLRHISMISRVFMTYTKYFTIPSWFSSGLTACSLNVQNRPSGEPSINACCTALYTAIGTRISVINVIMSTFFSHTFHGLFLYEGKTTKVTADVMTKVNTQMVKPYTNCSETAYSSL